MSFSVYSLTKVTTHSETKYNAELKNNTFDINFNNSFIKAKGMDFTMSFEDLLIYLKCRVTEEREWDRKGDRKERERKRDREKTNLRRDIFHLPQMEQVVNFSSGCNSQVWARLNPGTRTSTCVSHMGARFPSAWATIHCLLWQISRKLDGHWNRQKENQHSDRWSQCCKQQPKPLDPTPVLPWCYVEWKQNSSVKGKSSK